MRKIAFLLLLLSLHASIMLAQEQRVSGRIVNASGQPLEAVSVTVKGTARGTSTNSNGEFVIGAQNGQTLVFSIVGFANAERVVDGTTMNLSLVQGENTLDDVVVVGYGTQRRGAVTGSVVTLKNDVLTKRQVASTSSLLQGLAPGVTVQQQSGKPGADASSIRIRGVSSIYAGSSPLIMVDGVVSSLESIDPNAIESVTILKDAASTAIYGTRGANGVILVKTKRGTGKGITVSYNNFVSKQVATAIPERVSAIEHMELSNLAERNRTGNPNAFLYAQALIDKYKSTPPNNLDVIDTDWLDLLLTNSGILQNHNIQLSSGGEKVNVFTSVSYLTQQGLIPNNSFKKYDIRFNPDFKLTDKLTLSGVFNYNYNTSVNPATGSAEFIIRQAIGLPAIGGGKYGPGMYGTAGQTNNRNPLAMAEAAGTSFFEQNSFLSKVSLNYRPVNGLELEAFWARENWTPHGKTFVKNVNIYQPNVVTKAYDKIGVWPGTTSLGESYSTNTRTTYLAQATYSKQVGNHNFKLLAGGQTEEFVYSGISGSRTGFINPDQPFLNLGSGNINNAGSGYETALAGFYGRLNYNYDEKYFLEFNGRYDGSSRFSQALDKQWGFFPSVSAGWLLSKEKFWDGIADKISFAKLRGSIGSLGNQALPEVYPFAVNYQATTYSNPNNGTSTYFNNVTTLGYALLDAANPDISWETSKQWNVGLDLGINNNLNITFDYYVRRVEDILLLRPIPTYVGLNSPFVNAGDMENKGWEVSVNYRKTFGKLGVDVTGMLSDVKNKVTSLPGLAFLDGGSLRTQAGQALFSYFGYKSLGYFQDSNDIKSSPVQFGIPYSSNPGAGPKPGDIKYADISGPDGKTDGKVDAFDRTFLGNNFPRYEYSINLNLTYGAFDLNLFGQGVGKRDNYLTGTGAVPFNSADFAASLLDIHKDFWTADNRNATFPRLLPAGSGGNNYVASSHWIRSASYFRIKNVNLGYRLPQQWLQRVKINSVRIYASASNLFTFTKSWDGFDPEINTQDGQFYPLMKTFTAGVNINF
jgi:TonB-linked SusC/RagA family outer membrane protein